VTAADIWLKWDLGENGKAKLQANMVSESVAAMKIKI